MLSQNRPDPFSSATQMEYDLQRQGHVAVKVYNLVGQLVRILVDETEGPGTHVASWNGRSDSGNALAAGLYFCRVTMGGFADTKRMILVR